MTESEAREGAAEEGAAGGAAVLQGAAAGGSEAGRAPSRDVNMASEDEELEAMKRRVKEMEEEAGKLREMQAQVERDMASSMGGAAGSGDFAATAEADARSIYVGNVDYGSTPEELQGHFQACGVINRITIVCDRWTGQPKGFAYIEFADALHVANSMALNESLFRNRLLKVIPKRSNVPGFNARGGRGGYRGGAGGYRGGPPHRGAPGGRGASFHHRGSRSRRANYAPY